MLSITPKQPCLKAVLRPSTAVFAIAAALAAVTGDQKLKIGFVQVPHASTALSPSNGIVTHVNIAGDASTPPSTSPDDRAVTVASADALPDSSSSPTSVLNGLSAFAVELESKKKVYVEQVTPSRC